MKPNEILTPAALKQLEDAGYVVVPIEPTEEMIQSGFTKPIIFSGMPIYLEDSFLTNIYKTMIAATREE